MCTVSFTCSTQERLINVMWSVAPKSIIHPVSLIVSVLIRASPTLHEDWVFCCKPELEPVGIVVTDVEVSVMDDEIGRRWHHHCGFAISLVSGLSIMPITRDFRSLRLSHQSGYPESLKQLSTAACLGLREWLKPLSLPPWFLEGKEDWFW